MNQDPTTPLITDAQLLVVDDNEDNLYILKQRLQREGYRNIQQAVDGVGAMEILTSGGIDLVLLDVLMPEMDGYQVLKKIRNDPELHNIPVIMISAVNEIETVVRCIEAGAEDYLQKPFNTVLLRARVQACLEKKRLNDETIRQLRIIRSVFGKYVPESIVDSIISGGGNIEPMQSMATILYTDIADFTRICESMRPEHVVDMLNAYFESVIAVITRHGGIVNQLQGDAMLVTYNIPIADPQHADKAIQTAIEIQHTVIREKFAGITLATRIGINSGNIFAGNVGTGERMNYTVHGDAVNLAARLERLNKDNDTQVLISGDCVQLLTAKHPIEAMGSMAIRGKSTLVEIYRLIDSA
ncbi:MAG: adenylate/guanylate cyclase domain-containing response regulator [Gammaproteobacteria bacterium]|nr:adenylate/guanylate cyclase domain-containing response regulator [Gammaproteobacteria bacterium]MCP4980737.1 adenylate/guanylate cyclase domain-containing response regulator [Gammaproteobacteria bacterium]